MQSRRQNQHQKPRISLSNSVNCAIPKVIKSVYIYSKLTSRIKVIGRAQKETNFLKDIEFKQDYFEKTNQNNEIEEKHQQNTLNVNNTENINEANKSKERATSNETTSDNKQSANDSKLREDEKLTEFNLNMSGGSKSSQDDQQSDMKEQSQKTSAKIEASYGIASGSVEGSHESASKNKNSAHNASSKEMSGALGGGYKSHSKNKKHDTSSNANEAGNSHKNQHSEKEDQRSYIKNNDDVKVNMESNDSKNNKFVSEHEMKHVIDAKANFLNAEIDQQGNSEILIAPNAMGHIQMRLNDEHSLIYLTIFIEDDEGKWRNYCSNLGTDEAKLLFEENDKNEPNLKLLSHGVWEKLAMSNDEEFNLSKVAASNKEEMLEWDKGDVAEYLEYLSRKYVGIETDNIKKLCARRNKFDGEAMWTVTKQELESKGITNSATRRILFSELLKIRKGKVVLLPIEEYEPKISAWKAEDVKMFIATIHNGSFYNYRKNFEKVTGDDLLSKILFDDDLRDYGIADGGARVAIFERIHQVRINVNVPEKKDLYDGFKEIEKRKLSKKRKYEPMGRLKPGKPNKTLMVIGETGCGKSTTLNSMMNFLYDVEYDDVYRQRLIFEDEKEGGQAESQTDDVTAYYLDPPALPYQVTLIDCPGYNDTRGFEQDLKTTEKIKKFFETKVDSIDAICFVMKASSARLTPTQRYIFDAILSIFGKDIAENILVIMTWADASDPEAISALNKVNVPYRKYVKLNNSGFTSKTKSKHNELYWDMGMDSFKKLFDEVAEFETKSLQLTREVLEKRKQLQNHISAVNPLIKRLSIVFTDLQNQRAILEKNKKLIEQNKNFTITRTNIKYKKDYKNVNGKALNCMNCKLSCHNGCWCVDNGVFGNWTSWCYVMKKEHCTMCGCHHSCHKKTNYIFVSYEDKITETINDLKQKYLKANSKKSQYEQLMDATEKDLKAVEFELNERISGVRECLNQLSKIALRPNALSQIDYIDQMIELEKKENKKGMKQRVMMLEALKEQQEMLNKLKASNYKPVNSFSNAVPHQNKGGGKTTYISKQAKSAAGTAVGLLKMLGYSAVGQFGTAIVAGLDVVAGNATPGYYPPHCY